MSITATNNKNKFLLDVVKSVVTPAYGCTEVGAVALACSIAAEHLSSNVVSANIYVSTYIYRNDANVGVPNMGQVGIGAIATAGFLVKQSAKRLAVLEGITKQQVAKAIQMAKKGMVKITVAKDVDPVFVKVKAIDQQQNVCEVVIEHKHDFVRSIRLNHKLLIENKPHFGKTKKFKYTVADISLHDIFTSVSQMNVANLSFLNMGINMNNEILMAGIKKQHQEFMRVATSSKLLGDNWENVVLDDLLASVAARMEGCPLPVMASNDSGDHGLTVNVPQFVYNRVMKTPKLKMLQAIALANLICWKIKKNIGSLSAYCGSVVAAVTASICGIAYQRRANETQINNLINLCLCAFAGAVCDGAKLSCAWKIEAAYLSAFGALRVVESNGKLPDNEGIVSKDAFETIRDVGVISQTVRDATNSVVIDIVSKMIKSR